MPMLDAPVDWLPYATYFGFGRVVLARICAQPLRLTSSGGKSEDSHKQKAMRRIFF
jgi:hypothetical protein